MKFLEAVDYGAPEIAVLTIAEIKRISIDFVRVTYARQQGGEMVVAVHILYGYHAWLNMWGNYTENQPAILRDVNLPLVETLDGKPMH